MHEPPVPDGFVWSKPAAERAGVTEATLRNLVRRGVITAYSRPGTRRHYFAVADIEALCSLREVHRDRP